MGIVEIIILILGSSGFATLVTTFFMRRKIKSETKKIDVDAVQILTDTSLSMLEPMKKQVEFLNKQLVIANEQIDKLTTTADDLTEKLKVYELKSRIEFLN